MKLKDDIIILVDGPQGSGKSTCCQMLDEILREYGFNLALSKHYYFADLCKYYVDFKDYFEVIIVDELESAGPQPKAAINAHISNAYRIIILPPETPARHNFKARIFEIQSNKNENWFRDFRFFLKAIVIIMISDWKERGLVCD